jgi:hypothetical protein
VYERVGTLEDADISREREPSDYVATTRLTLGNRVFEPGDELPQGPVFSSGKQREQIGVTFDSAPDLERLVARGVARRKRGARRGRHG